MWVAPASRAAWALATAHPEKGQLFAPIRPRFQFRQHTSIVVEMSLDIAVHDTYKLG